MSRESISIGAKVYVAGPMSNVPQMNFPAFDDAAKDLRNLGFEVVSPAELDSPESRAAALASPDGSTTDYAEGETWGNFLARDVKLIADEGIEAIVCLPGWERSRGARLETFVGRLCGLGILEYPSMGYVTPGLIDVAHASKAVAASRLLDLTLEREDIALIAHDHCDAGAALAVTNHPVPVVDGEVRVTNAETGGQKGQKAQQFNLIPFEELGKVAELYAAGAKKYEAHNWRKGYAWSLSFDSLIRHAMAFWGGEDLDEETKCLHLASVVFHAFALMYFSDQYPNLDDRPCRTIMAPPQGVSRVAQNGDVFRD